MSSLLHIGFGNMVNSEKITAVLLPDSAPVKRIVQRGKEDGSVVDATQGRRTKSVLIMEGGRIILSALTPETIASRAGAKQKASEERMQEEDL